MKFGTLQRYVLFFYLQIFRQFFFFFLLSYVFLHSKKTNNNLKLAI